MSSEIIPCPACLHDVRVPESLFGQPVRCPACKAYFTAPSRDAQGNLGAAELLDHAPVTAQPDCPIQLPEQSSVFLPAILLLLVGIMSTLVNGLMAYLIIAHQEALKGPLQESLKRYAEFLKQPITQEQLDERFAMLPRIFVCAAFVSSLPLAGSVAMLRLRARWLALFGSVVAIFNIAYGCCLIGAPVGIYCLIKLCDPQIRAMFRRPRTAGAFRNFQA